MWVLVPTCQRQRKHTAAKKSQGEDGPTGPRAQLTLPCTEPPPSLSLSIFITHHGSTCAAPHALLNTPYPDSPHLGGRGAHFTYEDMETHRLKCAYAGVRWSQASYILSPNPEEEPIVGGILPEGGGWSVHIHMNEPKRQETHNYSCHLPCWLWLCWAGSMDTPSIWGQERRA